MTSKTKVNDQDEALYLLKTGTVLSVSNGIIHGEYNDGAGWTISIPSNVHVNVGSRAMYYRYHLEDDPETDSAMIIMNPFIFYTLIFNGSGKLLRHGVGRTSEESFFEVIR